MKVTFFIVNYNSDQHVVKFVNSIEIAQNEVRNLRVSIEVIDNSMKSDIEFAQFMAKFARANVRLHRSKNNLGYFGALNSAQKILDTQESDCVIYCNADLKVTNSFLVELKKLYQCKGIIAPSILAVNGSVDQNPKYSQRLPVVKLRRLRYIYSNVVTFKIFVELSRLKEFLLGVDKKKGINSKIDCIYAPHGAMFIFTDVNFFKNLPPYPCFLYGEEIFIGEEARKLGVPIYYRPALRVLDDRSVSTRLLGLEAKRKLYFESIRFLMKEYYCV